MQSIVIVSALLVTASWAFLSHKTTPSHYRYPLILAANDGDIFRAATGIRPSLHPITINAISEALKLRSANDTEYPMRVSDTVKPIDVAVASGRLAALALDQRQKASQEDGMTLDDKEEQTVAGRVVGVVMRLDALERELVEKTQSIEWIKKYNEWSSFGVMEDETTVEDRILKDPLFALTRAECLLAIFLHTVEKPTLEKVGQEVPDGTVINFIDEDRLQVLVG